MFNFFLPLAAESSTDTSITMTNPLTDANGEMISADEAVNNLEELVKNLFSADNIRKCIFFVVLIAAGLLISWIVSKIIVKGCKRAGIDSSVYVFVKRIISFIINFTFILWALDLFIDVNAILAAIAACGVAAALGLQNSVSQFVSGVQLLVTRQFKSGDYILVDGIEGYVAEIKFMNTVIHTIDNKKVIIPNSTMTSNKVVNYSAEKTRRIDLIYSISYSDDIAKAKKVILDYTATNDLILKNPAPEVYVNSHEASSINLVARVWCNTGDYWPVYFAMQENIKIAFDKNDINIPFNQLDVHVTNN